MQEESRINKQSMGGEKEESLEEQLAYQAEIAANATGELINSQRKNEELTSQVIRLSADFDNFRKRNEQERRKIKVDTAVDIISRVIPFGDNIEAAIKSVQCEQTKKGLEMLNKQFENMLAEFGVDEIKAQGEQFDHNYHNAVLSFDVDDESKKGIILEVFQKGYRVGERIIRYSNVKVGK